MILKKYEYSFFKYLKEKIKDTYNIDFEYCVNYAQNKRQNNYYFIINKDLNIEIVFEISDININLSVQKPHEKNLNINIDNRSIHAENKLLCQILAWLTILINDNSKMKV